MKLTALPTATTMAIADCTPAVTDAISCQETGNNYFREGDAAAACIWYGHALEALQADTTSKVSILCNRSAALLKLDRCIEAVADAALAVSLTPDAVKPRYRHAGALRALGALDEAIAACDVGLKLSPANAQLSSLRRSCLEELGATEEEEAAEHGVEAVQGGMTVQCDAPVQGGTAVQADTAVTQGDTPVQGDTVVQGDDMVEEGNVSLATGGNTAVETNGDELDVETDYAGWCRAAGNRLYREGEYGQACAWYGHAISALERGEGVGTDASQPSTATATLLSNRAAALLKLGRWADAAADCERAVALDGQLVKAYARGSAALMRLGATERSVSLAEDAVRMCAPPAEPRAERLEQLRGLGAKELRTLLRDAERAAARRQREAEAAEWGGERQRARAAGVRGRNAPCLVQPMTPSDSLAKSAADQAATAPQDKDGACPTMSRLEGCPCSYCPCSYCPCWPRRSPCQPSLTVRGHPIS